MAGYRQKEVGGSKAYDIPEWYRAGSSFRGRRKTESGIKKDSSQVRDASMAHTIRLTNR